MSKNKANFRSKVVSGGKITIPQHIRDSEEIEEGDYLDLTVEKVNDGGE